MGVLRTLKSSRTKEKNSIMLSSEAGRNLMIAVVGVGRCCYRAGGAGGEVRGTVALGSRVSESRRNGGGWSGD